MSDYAALMETQRLDAADRADAAYAEAHANLFHEALAALMEDPKREISAPGFGLRGEPPRQWTALEMVEDQFAGSDDFLLRALRIIARASKSTDTLTRLEAQSWLAEMAGKHADFHAEDAAEL